MAILKLAPSFKDYIWGGRRLIEEYHKPYDGDILAESWEVSCHPDGPSFVTNGEYAGKTLQYKGMVYKNARLPKGYFVPGRMAMTCCADDTAFIGFLCKSSHVDELKNKQWVTITAKAYVEKRAEYSGENGVVLRATHITSAEKPEEELVYF